MACVSEHHGPNFDVNVAIADFVSDPSQRSLELPRMTTGQRRIAKKAVDGYPDLKCESFGFGDDRQLHIFKLAVGEIGRSCVPELCAPNAVSIKNTYIDDWSAAMEHNEVLDAAADRSVPPKLSTKVARLCVSSDCSTVASSPPPGSPTSSVASFQEKPLLAPFRAPPGLEIRNTFLHFGGPPAAERVVQSMPHGMFGRCLTEEVSLRTTSKRPTELQANPDDYGTHMPRACATLSKGTEAIIDGLVKCPAFNGLRVVVDSFDALTARYSVLFTAPVAGHKSAKVRRENLLLICPPHPDFVPPLAPDGCPAGEEGFLSTWQAAPMWG